MYEGPSKSSVMNGYQYTRKGYASLMLYVHVHILYSVIHQRLKFRRNRANINIVVGIQRSLSHIHWHIFENEQKDSVGVGCAYYTPTGLPEGNLSFLSVSLSVCPSVCLSGHFSFPDFSQHSSEILIPIRYMNLSFNTVQFDCAKQFWQKCARLKSNTEKNHYCHVVRHV